MQNIGRNIARVRELKGVKQDELARLLGITQQAVSKIENKQNVEEDILEKIAEKLKVSAEAIKQFNQDATIQSLYQQGGIVVENLTINPLEKIIELYERLLNEKQETIDTLKKLNNEK